MQDCIKSSDDDYAESTSSEHVLSSFHWENLPLKVRGKGEGLGLSLHWEETKSDEWQFSKGIESWGVLDDRKCQEIYDLETVDELDPYHLLQPRAKEHKEQGESRACQEKIRKKLITWRRLFEQKHCSVRADSKVKDDWMVKDVVLLKSEDSARLLCLEVGIVVDNQDCLPVGGIGPADHLEGWGITAEEKIVALIVFL